MNLVNAYRLAETTKAQEVLGYRPRVAMQMGLLKTLEADIARYESQHGKIRVGNPGDPKPGIGFK